VPTLMAHQGLQEQFDCGAYKPPAIAAKADPAIASLHATFQKPLTKGVKIGLGTDAAVYPHGRNAEEFHQMVNLGMKPVDTLEAGTLGTRNCWELRTKLEHSKRGNWPK
jgi:imidazolonepropionase-like amidohydrolase